MEINLLDVGMTKYGDCILITRKGKSILIDGAHPGDSDLILGQLKKLLNQDDQVSVDLLIVTHCHSDHIGCLPALVTKGSLKVKYAIVSDEVIGFGRSQPHNSAKSFGALSDPQQKLIAMMQEEDHSDLSDPELKEFLASAFALEPNYVQMLDYLDKNATMVRYEGDPEAKDIAAIVNKFKDFGLEILGPTKEQLDACAEVIGQHSVTAGKQTEEFGLAVQSDDDVIAEYRKRMNSFSVDFAALKAQSVGAAKNDTSIVIKISADNMTALLAGDMQFADPGVNALKGEIMDTLLKLAVSKGPYDFVKLPHHSSNNGTSEDILDSWMKDDALNFGHSGGLNDATHPNPDTLTLLQKYGSELNYARTDHNGLITVSKNGKLKMTIERGELNDFHANDGSGGTLGGISGLATNQSLLKSISQKAKVTNGRSTKVGRFSLPAFAAEKPVGIRRNGELIYAQDLLKSNAAPIFGMTLMPDEHKAKLAIERLKLEPDFTFGILQVGAYSKKEILSHVAQMTPLGKQVADIEVRYAEFFCNQLMGKDPMSFSMPAAKAPARKTAAQTKISKATTNAQNWAGKMPKEVQKFLKSSVLFCENTTDHLTGPAAQYRIKNVHPVFASKGFNVIVLQGLQDIRTNFQIKAIDNSVVYIGGIGHGASNIYTGDNFNQILTVGAYAGNEVKGKVMHFLSCQTAAALGPDTVSKGALAYTGYSEDFVFDTSHGDLYWQCDSVFDINMANGKTVSQAMTELYKAFDNAIAQFPGTSTAANLLHNKTVLRSPVSGAPWGQQNAKISSNVAVHLGMAEFFS